MKPFLFFFIFSAHLFSQSTQPVYDLAQRNVPWLVPFLTFEVEKRNEGGDFFSIETQNNKILIKGNHHNALCKGLGHYLNHYLGRNLSNFGENLSKVEKIVFPEVKIEKTSPFLYRYALNYCTISYSMAFDDFKAWEKHLDFFALNGVNLILAPIGVEAVWQETLKRLKFSDKEIKEFIATPAFSAWWLMGNLEGWQGEISDRQIKDQKQLAKKIFQRLKELDINPVYQGFYGMVPSALKNKYAGKIIEQGLWAGGFSRPDFLSAEDQLFTEVSDIYYEEVKKQYGEFKFFAGDPFHEGGQTKGISVKKASENIQKEMLKHFPEAIWVLQGWQENPSEELLSGINKEKALILELEGENSSNWAKRNFYNDTPFVWCQITNFGAKQGLYGKLQRFIDEVEKLKQTKNQNFKGIGIIPEGLDNNPIAYQLTFDLAWQNNKTDLQDYLKAYSFARYGINSQEINQSFKIFTQTCYASPEIYQQSAPESILCARPSFNLKSVSSWGTLKRHYDPTFFEEGAKIFLSQRHRFKHIPTYNIDKIDILRQIVANRALILYDEIQSSVLNQDLPSFRKKKEAFLELILIQDEILGTEKLFRLDNFLKKAEKIGKNKKDRLQNIKNAKTQITFWGIDTNSDTNLRDYAHKEWNGILKSLYFKRWNAFFEYQEAILMEKAETKKAPDFFQMEKDWAYSPEMISEKPISEEKLEQIIKNLGF